MLGEVGEQGSVDGVGQSAFEAADGFHRGLAGVLLVVVVGAAIGRLRSWTVAMMCRVLLI
jgi:hypothetical protein